MRVRAHTHIHAYTHTHTMQVRVGVARPAHTHIHTRTHTHTDIQCRCTRWRSDRDSASRRAAFWSGEIHIAVILLRANKNASDLTTRQSNSVTQSLSHSPRPTHYLTHLMNSSLLAISRRCVFASCRWYLLGRW